MTFDQNAYRQAAMVIARASSVLELASRNCSAVLHCSACGPIISVCLIAALLKAAGNRNPWPPHDLG